MGALGTQKWQPAKKCINHRLRQQCRPHFYLPYSSMTPATRTSSNTTLYADTDMMSPCLPMLGLPVECFFAPLNMRQSSSRLRLKAMQPTAVTVSRSLILSTLVFFNPLSSEKTQLSRMLVTSLQCHASKDRLCGFSKGCACQTYLISRGGVKRPRSERVACELDCTQPLPSSSFLSLVHHLEWMPTALNLRRYNFHNLAGGFLSIVQHLS